MPSPFARRVVLCLGLAVAAVTGCGGSARPATTASSAAGVAALAPDMPSDLVLTMDVAAMRTDKVLAKIMSKGEASADPDLREFMSKIDQLDIRASGGKENPACVAILWGRFPKEPTDLALLGPKSPHPLVAAPALASGVREYTGEEKTHLFVVSESAWVVTVGAPSEKIRARLATAGPMPAPTGELFHGAAQSTMLGDSKGPLAGLDHAELTLTPGMGSFKALLMFKDESGAKESEAKVQMLTGLVLAAISSKSKDCKALGKLEPAVSRETSTVTIELKGIGEAADLWDPATCPALGPEAGASVAATDGPPPASATTATTPTTPPTRLPPRQEKRKDPKPKPKPSATH